MKNFLNRLGMTVLTAAMLTLPVTGCGGSSDTGAAGSTSAAGNASSAAAGSETDNDEIVKLRVWGFGYTATSDDCAAVAEAINEITRDEIGVEIELVRSGDGEKLNLALTSGEQPLLTSVSSWIWLIIIPIQAAWSHLSITEWQHPLRSWWSSTDRMLCQLLVKRIWLWEK